MDKQQSMIYGDPVTKALLTDPRTKDAIIDVANEHGIVTLNGMVERETIRKAAEEIARQQKGVISVINEIRVLK